MTKTTQHGCPHRGVGGGWAGLARDKTGTKGSGAHRVHVSTYAMHTKWGACHVLHALVAAGQPAADVAGGDSPSLGLPTAAH
jgi:hypothetical protein